jgi:hypothetical protein
MDSAKCALSIVLQGSQAIEASNRTRGSPNLKSLKLTSYPTKKIRSQKDLFIDRKRLKDDDAKNTGWNLTRRF